MNQQTFRHPGGEEILLTQQGAASAPQGWLSLAATPSRKINRIANVISNQEDQDQRVGHAWIVDRVFETGLAKVHDTRLPWWVSKRAVLQPAADRLNGYAFAQQRCNYFDRKTVAFPMFFEDL
jgi:hypothetical protein